VLVANIGDAKAVLARLPGVEGSQTLSDERGSPLKAIVVTREHKAIYPQERARIQKCKLALKLLEEAQFGAPTGKRSHKESFIMVETHLNVLEASLEELYQGQRRLLGVESSQEEAKSRIDKVESLVDRLTEDTKDSVQHLHEVVAELMSKAGGSVGSNGRLQGRLEVSRAFGDRQFKKVVFGPGDAVDFVQKQLKCHSTLSS
ncbi:hypothetical protein BHM03_00029922, partial [Ensete ventricosum]